ncbi:hypothetical protein VOLCADRAFT_100181 [Volvox carteri f. nagariensis]|uniref:Uncharacterized protein n=1 Tax=Volvox carteri f. nagariensis TaxID=3068 RepID=D8UJL8_VOLCA|nr:uncharacterized protein VOLCADRAFT_100181 [Volvox carteri f. nagariensis]EFJ40090.1 hypothetical protein VOLCADRAFT_100181 [Volvox carteri f. nagariensis]|eukprot:XP_002958839.1 hypothetical protein VOLCADRAFT_100181 [Volvox carteri f. nagariensis]
MLINTSASSSYVSSRMRSIHRTPGGSPAVFFLWTITSQSKHAIGAVSRASSGAQGGLQLEDDRMVVAYSRLRPSTQSHIYTLFQSRAKLTNLLMSESCYFG